MAPFAPGAERRRDKPLRSIPPNQLNKEDPNAVVQQTHGPAVNVATGLNFAGIGEGDYGFSDQFAPPDTNGAVGATQYVQWVNVSFAVFDKTTGAIVPGSQSRQCHLVRIRWRLRNQQRWRPHCSI